MTLRAKLSRKRIQSPDKARSSSGEPQSKAARQDGDGNVKLAGKAPQGEYVEECGSTPEAMPDEGSQAPSNCESTTFENKKTRDLTGTSTCRRVGALQQNDIERFKAYVREQNLEHTFPSNKVFRNHCYYTYATEKLRIRGRGRQWRVPDNWRKWIKEEYPDTL